MRRSTSRCRSSSRPAACRPETRCRTAWASEARSPSSAAMRVRGVHGLGVGLARHLAQPSRAHERQVGGNADGEQGLAGADVRGCLFAADVLLARLQSEHEPPPSVVVGRLTRLSDRATGANRPSCTPSDPPTGRRYCNGRPSDWPSAVAISAPQAPGELQQSERRRVRRRPTISSAPRAWTASASPFKVAHLSQRRRVAERPDTRCARPPGRANRSLRTRDSTPTRSLRRRAGQRTLWTTSRHWG